jgi:putative membrane protein
MTDKRIHVAALVAATLLLTAAAIAQDPSNTMGGGTYSNTSLGANQQTGTGMNGQMNGQSNTPGTTQPGQASSMRDSLGAPGQTGQQMLDQQFIRNAAEADIADEQFSKLAIVKGSPAVQKLAQKLVDDHTMMGKDMDIVADSMAVMVPKKMNKEHQKEYDKLNSLSGKDFDTEYLTYTATAHYEDLHTFHMEASVAANPDLATEAVKEMGTMHQHLGLIQSAAKEEGVVMPPRPQRPPSTTASK